MIQQTSTPNYIGEKSLRQVYENDEAKQEDTANFVELVAASALFDFLEREKPETPQYLSRAIEEDADSLDKSSLGDGYNDIVKCVADYLILRQMVLSLPSEDHFTLKKDRGFDENFYKDTPFKSLEDFTNLFFKWYSELATNRRAFAPIHYDNPHDMSGWIKGMDLDAKDDSYYLLDMIRASNKSKKEGHSNKFRFFLEFAYSAIDKYTKKINK